MLNIDDTEDGKSNMRYHHTPALLGLTSNLFKGRDEPYKPDSGTSSLAKRQIPSTPDRLRTRIKTPFATSALLNRPRPSPVLEPSRPLAVASGLMNQAIPDGSLPYPSFDTGSVPVLSDHTSCGGTVDDLGSVSESRYILDDEPVVETDAIKQARQAKAQLERELAELRERELALGLGAPMPTHPVPEAEVDVSDRTQTPTPHPSLVASAPEPRADPISPDPTPSSRIQWMLDVSMLDAITDVDRVGTDLTVKFEDGAACALFAAHMEMIRQKARASDE